MLTLPSEPLPQTVLMEAHPSVPPSFVNYGLVGSRRSPRKHLVSERRAKHKPYNKLTSNSQLRHNTDTNDVTQVPASLNAPSRLERMPLKNPPSEDRLDTGDSLNICETLTRPQISAQRIPPLTETPDGPHVDSELGPLQTHSALGPDEAPKGWVIGPLYQSFKSKMASFTEIIMSPFKTNVGHECTESCGENTTEGYNAAEEAEIQENQSNQHVDFEVSPPKHGEGSPRNQQTDFAVSPPERVNKSVKEEAELSNQENQVNQQGDVRMSPLNRVNELELAQGRGLSRCTADFFAKSQSYVPLRILKMDLDSSVTQSAWNTSTTITTSFHKVVDKEEEEVTSRRARARKRPNKVTAKGGNDGEEHGIKDMECTVLRNTSSGLSRNGIGESQADRTPTSPSILEDASLKKVKRTLNLSCDTSKRRRPSIKSEEGGEGEKSVRKREPKQLEELSHKGQKTTRAKNKKCKVSAALPECSERNLEHLIEFGGGYGLKDTKAKAKLCNRNDTKVDLQTPPNETLLDTLTTTLDSKSETSAFGKKRKAKDNSNPRSSLSAGVLKAGYQRNEAEECAALGQKQKKIKTRKGEVKMHTKAAEKVHFEMTPPESDTRQVPQSDEKEREAGVRKRRARHMEPQRRKCRAIHVTKSPTKWRAEEAVGTMTLDDSNAFKKGSSTRLQRSVSCPEIPALRLHEAPWTPHFHSPPRSRSQPPQQQHATPHGLSSLAHHFHRSARRARRHTVCSVEVEREIAPLCLRKEVYPTRRSPFPYDPQHGSPMRALSPGASLSALASVFLSSPLAFLSKKEGEVSSPRALSPSVRLVSQSHNSPRSLSPAASFPTLSSLLGTPLGQLPGFHLRTDTLLNALSDVSNSGASELPPAPEEDEETSSSSPESEELREETTHSDSELKTLKKDQSQRKVSSIKIRKALPKPQNNLTPMGLPKAVRVKKKEFSLEEIYTNKNFSKPPESRLETIFEVPLNRKNGSESWCGPRRFKRALKFPELGEARRPRKPPAGGGATKANANNSRPRRGGSREDPTLGSDPDSLLCSKLEQLRLWLQEHDS